MPRSSVPPLLAALATLVATPVAQAQGLRIETPTEVVVHRQHETAVVVETTRDDAYLTRVARPASGPPCAAVAADDPGVRYADPYEGTALRAQFAGRYPDHEQVDEVGDRRVCAWLHRGRDQRGEVLARAEASYTVRRLRASMRFVRAGQVLTSPSDTQLEAFVEVDAEVTDGHGADVRLGGHVQPASRPCPAEPPPDPAWPLNGGSVEERPARLQGDGYVPHGDVRLCIHLVDARAAPGVPVPLARLDVPYATLLRPLVERRTTPEVRRVGRGLLACRRGRWIGRPAPAIAISWWRAGKRIPGAHGRRLRHSARHATSSFTCRVEAVNAAGRTVVSSPPLRPRSRT